MDKKNIAIVLVICLIGGVIGAFHFGLIGAGPAQEQAPKKQVKVYEINDDATFAEKTKLFSLTPLRKPDLAFTINVPKTWEAEQTPDDGAQELNQQIMNEIASFRSPLIGVQRAYLSIQALRLEVEISAKNWLKHYIISNGYTLDGEIESTDQNDATASFVSAEGINTFINRMKIRKNGNALMIATFKTPINLKEYMSFLQKKTVESFGLSNPKPDAPVETQKNFTLVDAIKFSHPLSWEVAGSDFSDMNNLIAQLHYKNPTGLIEGFLNIIAIRRTRSADFMTEVNKMKEFFNTSFNFEFLSMSYSGHSPVPERFLFNRLEIYEVQNKDKTKRRNPQELHLVVLGDKDWYIFIYMITPREKENLYAWARNTQSFDVMLKSIK